MGSQKNPRLELDDPKLVEVIEHAFNASWAVLLAHDPFRDFAKDFELKTALSQKLIGLAAEGVTDPEQLRSMALAAFPLVTLPKRVDALATFRAVPSARLSPAFKPDKIQGAT